MRNPVARNDYNRAATHPDRSKRPQNSVEEGLLDYYAENAQSVAQSEYNKASGWLSPGQVVKKSDHPDLGRVFINGKILGVIKEFSQAAHCPPLSEEDKNNRILRVTLCLTPTPGTLEELLDSFVKR